MTTPILIRRSNFLVPLADGARDAEEDRLLRMVANLLGLTDVESNLARQRAERDEGRE